MEFKLDGARIQVHRDGDDVRVWTRRCGRSPTACPNSSSGCAALPCETAVLDGETWP